MFTDIRGHFFESVIGEAHSIGLVGGYPEGTFLPDIPITRAEATALVLRLYHLMEPRVARTLAKVLPSVVVVSTPDGSGSGTIITSDGLVLTNHHVIAGQTTVSFNIPGMPYAEGVVVRSTPELDLALCQIQLADLHLPVLPLAERSPQEGDTVMAIGAPLQLVGSATKGIVSNPDRQYMDDGFSINELLQVDCPVNPGNSGGALVDLEGNMVGVPSMKIVRPDVDGIAFAIGLEDIREFLKG